MSPLLKDIQNCTHCIEHLPHGCRPVMSASPDSKVIIIGQAPGAKVHASGIPWDDKSGDNLRDWMGVTKEQFYNADNFAILPMGFCYPGKGKSGDLPPRPECAPLWHQKVLEMIVSPRLILLIGKYAQDYYLQSHAEKNLTETVQNYKQYLPQYLPLPHPSPRNNIWKKKNPWFENKLLPFLKNKISEILSKDKC